ncbi:DUF4270 domain-containing protein [Flavobacterium hungaricum]|uniref:DUF4270 domain-containing protein n=1 Tax=Flavobacterium hungaricum TaxID=2082725 RepID=A0ABR9TQ01_9FLAO|nr:DUF4270 domain-containing protein [Flavobacterium hungaricum]MBE8727457.1 DUF4270 domain-containing protein [Flavobacterium hungaricum]
MYNTSLIKKILLAAVVVFLYSCDKDFNAIGDDLISDDHFGLEPEKYDVLAFNQEVTPIQSNNLATNALGIYNDPVFGETTANFATQVTLETYAPTIGEDPKVESVVLSIPYFSHITQTNTDGSHVYALDSIFGDKKEGKIKLSVYQNGMQMRNSYFDNGTQLAQLYYTDQNASFESLKASALLNDDADKTQNDEFFFSAVERNDSIAGTDGKKTLQRTKPEMRLNLNQDEFLNKILKAPAAKLSSANVFQEYYRGLYFKVEKSAASATTSMGLMNFAEGKITITYNVKTDITTDDESKRETRTVVLKLGSSLSTANFLQNQRNATYENAITNVNTTEGDERLYLKGGQGSMAILRLNDFASKLESIRDNSWMVNEANLVFYIDAEKMAPTTEAMRVYLYNLSTNLPLPDYYNDGTSAVNSDPKYAKQIFSGIINLDDNKRGKSYKIRITDHIRSLIKDKTYKNVDLGLVVTEDIATVTSSALKNKIQIKADPIEYFIAAPRASVMNPLGTILYGGKSSVSEDKRLMLQVYYTKPNK